MKLRPPAQAMALYRKLQSTEGLMSMLKGAGGVFIFSIVGLAASYLLQVFLGRWMGPSGLGNFNYAFTWGRFLSIFGDFGVALSSLKFIPEYRAKEDWGRLKGVLIAFTGLALLGCSVMALGAIFFFGTFPPDDIALITLFAGLALTPLIALKELYMETLRALNYIALAYAPAHVAQHLIVLAAAAAIFLTSGELTSLQAVGGLALSLVLVVIVQLIGLVRTLRPQLKRTKPIFEIRHWVRRSLPMMAIKSFVMIMERVDIIMVGLILGSFATGIYSVAARMATLCSFGRYAVNAITAPKIAPLYNEGKMDELQRLARQSSRLSFLAGLVLFVVIAVFSQFWLSIFGEEFIVGQTALVLLSLAYLINSGLGPVGYLMHLTDYYASSTRIHVISLIVNIGLNAVMIPTMGIEGAALATAFAALFQNFWLYFAVRKYLNIDTLPIKLW